MRKEDKPTCLNRNCRKYPFMPMNSSFRFNSMKMWSENSRSYNQKYLDSRKKRVNGKIDASNK